MNIYSFFILALSLTLSFSLSAQHHPDPQTEPIPSDCHQEKAFPHFRIAPLIGHTFVPAGQPQEASEGASPDRLIIPSWGLDIEYWFNHDWGIGLHNDLEIQSFLVESENEEHIERDFPLVITLDALYRPWKGLVLVAGPGYEIESNEDFWLFRAGIEYEFELNHHWDISPAFIYDSRLDAYDTWSIALGVGKRF